MTNPALGPSFLPTATFPTLPLAQISQDEAQIANQLAMRLFEQLPVLQVNDLYYGGLQKLQDLGIAVPPSLANLRTIVGWPRIGIDALDERLTIEGFRYPGTTQVDDEMQLIWQTNNMDSEHTLVNLDALVFGRSYLIAGVRDDDSDIPLLTGESPLNMTAIYDPRLRAVTAALQIYLDSDFTSDTYGQEVAALYLPGKTLQMARSSTIPGAVPLGKWELIERDDHGFKGVPVVRVANRQRTGNRNGMSEITEEIKNWTDIGCRTALAMDIGREFYAAPRRYVLGLSEDDFRKSDGTKVPAWQSYMSRIWTAPRSEDGQLPQVGEFKTGDPVAYTSLLDECRKELSGMFGLPPHYFGLNSDGNPASADAIRANEARLERRAKRKTVVLSDPYEDAMRICLAIRHGGELPDKAARIEADWADVATPTPAATADMLTKLIAEGALPARSDVVGKRAGFNATERARIESDWAKDPGAELMAAVQSNVLPKQLTALHRFIAAIEGMAQLDGDLAAGLGQQPPAPPADAPPIPATPASS